MVIRNFLLLLLLILSTTLTGQDKTPREVFAVVEQAPVFRSGCAVDDYACTQDSLLHFIYSRVQYPEAARVDGIEGTAYIGFVVELDGTISEINIHRDPGGDLGAEAARVIGLLNTESAGFTPGRRGGRAVLTRYSIPIKFKLLDKDKRKRRRKRG